MRNNVLAFTGYRINPMKKYAAGVLCLHTDCLVFEPDTPEHRKFAFPIDRIEGLAFLRRHIEFYVDRTLYRFRFLSKYGSSLKWNDAITILKEEFYRPSGNAETRGVDEMHIDERPTPLAIHN
jgi:hypothetical protein